MSPFCNVLRGLASKHIILDLFGTRKDFHYYIKTDVAYYYHNNIKDIIVTYNDIIHEPFYSDK